MPSELSNNTSHFAMRKRVAVAIPMFLFLVFTFVPIGGFRFYDTIIDESFVTARYAANLADGRGLVFNRTGEHVEGYTNFLLVVSEAVGITLGVDPIQTARFLGILATGGQILLMYVFIYRYSYSIFLATLIPCIFAVTPAVWTAATSGLETALFSFWVLLQILLTLFYFERKKQSLLIAIGITMLLSGLTRPEGVLISLINASAILLKTETYQTKVIILLLTTFVLPGFAYFVWRWSYFGWFFPNTFYVKEARNFYAFAQTVGRFIHYLWMVFPFFLLGFFQIMTQQRRQVVGPLLANLLSVFAYLGFSLRFGIGHRFFIFTYPIILILSSFYLLGFFANLNSKPSLSRGSLKAVMTLLLLLYPFSGFYNLWYNNKMAAKGIEHAHIRIGKILGEFSNDGSLSFVANNEVGAISYYSGWRVAADFSGLVDPIVSHHSDPKVLAEHAYKSNPEVLVISSTNVDSLEVPRGNPLTSDSRFHHNYEESGRFIVLQPGTTWKKGGIGWALYVYVLKGSPKLDPLRHALESSSDKFAERYTVDPWGPPW
jgi:arabinofuranosyltransferase